MNYRKYILTGFFIFTAVYILGCSKIYNKLDPEPPMARNSKDWPANANFDAQADNATLSSMTVADIHFVPYRSELNSLGRARLTAIASYLEMYGGEVIVDSQQGDKMIREQRLATVEKFLVGQGLDAERLAIVSDLTRGRGQDANEATLFYQKNLLGEESTSSAASSAGAAALSAASAEQK